MTREEYDKLCRACQGLGSFAREAEEQLIAEALQPVQRLVPDAWAD